ncbi:MAG: 16S rRNA (guanine1516-N2)-methyltransferase [Halioglobus sp.]
MISVAVAATNPAFEDQAITLASKLGLQLLASQISPQSVQVPDIILFVSAQGLSLQATGKNAPGPISVEFGSPSMRHRRRSGQNEMLGRAVGAGKKARLQVLDATAGLGRDSFVMADLGCCVSLCERQPIIGELLADGLRAARQASDEWLRSVSQRIEIFPGDARELDSTLLQTIEVIYLDPMFPARNKSASVKKEMALFQSLLDETESESDADDLLQWSLEQDVARVVVKRPAKAPNLAERTPAHTIAGKSVRYDVYVKSAIS